MKLNIRVKLIGPLILIMINAALMITVAYFSLQNIRADEERRLRIFSEFAAVSLTKSALARQDAPVHDYLINDDISEKTFYDRFVAETRRRLNSLEKNFALSKKEKQIITRVKKSQERIESDAEQIFTIPNPVGNKIGVQLMRDLDAKREQALGKLDELHRLEQEKIKSGLPFHERLIQGTQNNILFGLLIIFLIFLIFIYLVSRYVSQPILKLHRGVEEMSMGNLGVRVNLQTGDELQDLAEVFNDMAFNLSQEQQTAAKIQRRLLPQKQPKVPGINLFAKQALAKIVGGDWYDYYRLGDNLFVLIADASGKGMPGALLSTVTMSTMRSEPKTEVPLIELLKKTNKTVVNRLGAEDFVTLFAAQLNLNNYEFNYVNCGQEPPLIFQPSSGSWSTLKTASCLPIGISEPLFNPTVEVIKLSKGTRLILFTDGLHDVRDRQGRFFALELVIAWLNENKQLPLPSLIGGLVDKALKFGQGQLIDDITLLGMEII